MTATLPALAALDRAPYLNSVGHATDQANARVELLHLAYELGTDITPSAHETFVHACRTGTVDERVELLIAAADLHDFLYPGQVDCLLHVALPWSDAAAEQEVWASLSAEAADRDHAAGRVDCEPDPGGERTWREQVVAHDDSIRRTAQRAVAADELIRQQVTA